MNNLAFQLNGVCKSFRHFSLQGINLELPKGQIMGFVGPNGAGKSTTMRILLGLMKHDSGTVDLLGRSMPEEQIVARRQVGFVSEDMRLYGSATLAWHIRFVRSLYPEWDDDYSRELIGRFELESDQKVKQFSHGQRVKAALLLALARRPQLLVLDEPTTGLDPVVRQEVLTELLETLQSEERSVFFSSHNTQDVEQICDLVTFIHKGRILESDDKETFLDRWRLLSLRVEPDSELALPSACTWKTLQGRHGVLQTSAFSETLLGDIRAQGATVLEVERMTLEEIFMARVGLTRRAA